jgi:hypothetical protein
VVFLFSLAAEEIMSEKTADYWTAATTYATRYARESRRQKRDQPEYREQCAFFERVRWARKQYPDELGYALCFAVPNGAWLPRKQDRNGEWYSPEGRKLRAAGMEVGIPDVLCLVARGGFNFLALEFKMPGNYLSPDQRDKRTAIEKAGGEYVICYSGEAAWETMQWYLRGDKP